MTCTTDSNLIALKPKFRIKAELDEVKANTDTLKVGQRIIFDEVKKNAEKSFWDFF